MPSKRLLRGLATLAFALTLGTNALAGGPQGDPTQARELYKKGKKAYEEGNLREAYEAYLAAWKLQKSFDIAGNLASIELETARYRDAAEHLKFALANLPVSGDADKRRMKIESLLRDAKKQIGTLTIKATPDTAEISVDGHVLPRAEVEGEVFVDAGDHVISATARDHTPTEQKIRVAKGSSTPVVLTLAKGASTQVVGPAPGPSPLTVTGFIASGLGFAAGTALAIVSKTKSDAAESQFDALANRGPNACAGASPSDVCRALHDARASRDTFANAAFWTFIGAAVVAGGTLTYTLVSSRTPAKPTSARTIPPKVVPFASPAGGGLFIQGSF